QWGIAAGKRVVAPVGRGDKPTIGYCVNVTWQAPTREVKQIGQVLDDEPLLTPNLLKLTRWMADYYVCGWGQVLNAVVPAGAREQAGTRKTTFIEAVPESLCPNPLPTLTAKQAAVLERLRGHGQPSDARRRARPAKCGSAPIHALLDKNRARRVVRRVETVDVEADAAEQAPEPTATTAEPINLNWDQTQAWSILEPALQKGGFHT